MGFRNWLEMSSLRNKISGVPQNPQHHPEGDVWTHTRMVRKALPQALDVLRQAQQAEGSSLSEFNFSLDPTELDILRAAAWMHDIGKTTATAWTDGKGWQALGHESPQHFIPNMRDLGSAWQKIWASGDFAAKKDLFFIINHHMSLRDGDGKKGFGRQLSNKWVDANGKYANTRRVKLLLVLLMMDRIGRGVDDPIGAAWKGVAALEQGAEARMKRAAHQSVPAPDDEQEFIAALQQAGKPWSVIQQAFRGKFGKDIPLGDR